MAHAGWKLGAGATAAAVLAACSPAGAGASKLAKVALDAHGCPAPNLVLDDKGDVFHNGRSIDNQGDGAGVQEAAIGARTIALIATLPDGAIYWNCEKITQDELDRRFVAARAAARQPAALSNQPAAATEPSPPVPPAGGNP